MTTETKKPEMPRFMLVYQFSIANVFRVERFSPDKALRGECVRVLQADFRSCEYYCRGACAAGAAFMVAACNFAGDAVLQDWTYDFDRQPFRDKFNPPKDQTGVGALIGAMS